MYNMRESNDINSLIQKAIVGIGIIILAYLLGKTVTGYEVGVHLGNNYVSPHYRVSFLNP